MTLDFNILSPIFPFLKTHRPLAGLQISRRSHGLLHGLADILFHQDKIRTKEGTLNIDNFSNKLNLLLKEFQNIQNTPTHIPKMSASGNAKKSMKRDNTQLTNIMDLPNDRQALKEELKKRLIFEDAVFGTHPTNKTITFYRINIGIKNPDDSEGEVIIGLDRSFSFGVSTNYDESKTVIQSYSYPISMYDRNGATDHQLRSVQFIEVLSEVCQEYTLQPHVKQSLSAPKTELHHLEKYNPLYYPEDKKTGERIQGKSPNFYPKLLWVKAGVNKNGKEVKERMFTRFYAEDEDGPDGEPLSLNPLEFLDKKHYTTAAVKFESIFFGAKTKNIQTKVYEAVVKAADSGSKRLLRTAVRVPPSMPPSADGANSSSSASSSASSSSSSSSSSFSVPAPPKSEKKPLEASDDEAEEGEGEEAEKAPEPVPEPKSKKEKKDKGDGNKRVKVKSPNK